MSPTAKITWLVVIVLLPIFSVLLDWYNLYHSARGKSEQRFGWIPEAVVTGTHLG